MDGRVIGVDSYNLCLTGEIGRCLATSSGGLNEHIPVVIIEDVQMDEGMIAFDVYNMAETGNVDKTLNAIRSDTDHVPTICYGVDCRNGVMDEEKTHTIQAKPQGGYSLNCTPSVCYAIQGNCVDRDTKQSGCGVSKDVCHTLNTQDKHAVCFQNTGQGWWNQGEIAECIRTPCGGDATKANLVMIEQKTNEDEDMESYQNVTGALLASGYEKLGLQEVTNGMYVACSYDGSQVSPTLTRNNAGGSQRMPDKENFNAVIEQARPPRKYILRRLTPTECARLQGFPDWWTDGTDGSDSAVYKMWGNGIALPCAADVIGRIAKTIESEETV